MIVERLEDSRGWIERHEAEGVKFNVVFSRAGTFRGGDEHPNTQHNFLLSGCAKIIVRRPSPAAEVELRYSPFWQYEIPPQWPHLFEFLEDTVMLEWWDGPFDATYYPPFREIVERSLEGK